MQSRGCTCREVRETCTAHASTREGATRPTGGYSSPSPRLQCVFSARSPASRQTALFVLRRGLEWQAFLDLRRVSGVERFYERWCTHEHKS